MKLLGFVERNGVQYVRVKCWYGERTFVRVHGTHGSWSSWYSRGTCIVVDGFLANRLTRFAELRVKEGDKIPYDGNVLVFKADD